MFKNLHQKSKAYGCKRKKMKKFCTFNKKIRSNKTDKNKKTKMML